VTVSGPFVLRREPNSSPPRNRQEQVLDELGGLVVAGAVAPGATLPIEPALAAEFGVSKTVIREAIRGLAAKGLVRTSPRRGTIVCQRDDWHLLDPDVLVWHLRAETGPNMLRDFEEFRRAVEPMGARLAAERATDEDKQLLRAAFELMQQTADEPERYLAADLDFHTALLTATENEMLRGLRNAVRAALAVRHESAAPVLGDMRESMPSHEQVLVAVEAGDPDAAAAAMEQLLALSIRDDARLRPGRVRRPASASARRRARRS
jgi:DNA-binding FadR family transcriptional regulator